MSSLTNKVIQDKFQAAWELLTEDTTSLGKVNKIKDLVQGFDPKIDQLLNEITRQANKIDKIYTGQIIALSADELPENTPNQKKRKKALIFFITSWNSLKSEVKRINNMSTPNQPASSSPFNSLPKFFKGPFGIITIAATAIVVASTFIQKQLVTLTIVNQNCPTITPTDYLPNNFPGLSQFKDGISSGSSKDILFPPLTFTSTGSTTNLIISVLGFNFSFSPDPGSNITFNGQSLLNHTTTINLAQLPRHTITITCPFPNQLSR